MTVKELIAQLQAFDSDLEVIIQKDGEGNDYSPCVDVVSARYVAETTCSGWINGESTHQNAIVLCPAN